VRRSCAARTRRGRGEHAQSASSARDEYCIWPPPPEQGFQIHFGPSNYKNPEPEYLLELGEEWVHKFSTTSANDTDIKFYIRQYRMRPGAHHTIVRDTSTGRRPSGVNVNQDHPLNGIIAPENARVGTDLVTSVRADKTALVCLDTNATRSQPRQGLA
jgi:hypothetical protein